MDQKQSQNQTSSLIPVLLLGIATVLLFQLLDYPQPKKVVEQQSVSSPATGGEKQDFLFDNTGYRKDEILIENAKNVFLLSNLGGRIERVYIKSSEDVNIPEIVIEQSQDPLEKQFNAIEVTRYKGIDFQPHLYKNQIVEPVLNKAFFEWEQKEINDETRQVVFKKDVVFKDHPLTLYKIYRFFKSENFFHQITVIRNQSDKDFVLMGDLFYKTFSSLGPEPDDLENVRILSTYGRFYHYDGSLNHMLGFSPNGGFFGCSSPPSGRFKILAEKPDTLKYAGVNSRYFIAYSEFLKADENLHNPDGIILENYPPVEGTSTFSAVFSDFKLEKKNPEELKILTLMKEEITDTARGYSAFLKEDKKRKDVLVIDQLVYIGLRNDDEHRFQKKEEMLGEFGIEKLEGSVRDVIYTSGFLALFSKLRDGIVYLMRFINKYVDNYGVSIILLAIFFKLVTYPLNQIQAKTMKKLNKLKPELDRINERFQDPAERQKKIMDLYKKHKINPAMGCFPVLIQIPIFIALYSAFAESIELWKSPFILWMKDLSQPDTVFVIKDLIIVKNFHVNILPLLMVASQILQQKLTMVSADPQQKFLLYFMPLIMLFFFWGMPSGVTLYWTVQNIISIIWQLAVEKFSAEE